MGLQWGKPYKVKEDTLLVLNAPLPAAKNESEEFWNLWKQYKDQIKKDGFSISKDKYTGAWKAAYFHTVNDDTYEKTTDNKDMWRVDFEKKCAKWGQVIRKFREAAAQIEEDLIDDLNNLEVVEDDN
jgi:hypothetical protein